MLFDEFTCDNAIVGVVSVGAEVEVEPDVVVEVVVVEDVVVEVDVDPPLVDKLLVSDQI